MQIFTQICCIYYSNLVKYLLKTYFFLLRCQSLPTEALRVHTFPISTAKLARESAISCHKLRKSYFYMIFWGELCNIEHSFLLFLQIPYKSIYMHANTLQNSFFSNYSSIKFAKSKKKS